MRMQKIKKFFTSISDSVKTYHQEKYLPVKNKIFLESEKEFNHSDKRFLLLFVSWSLFFLFLFIFFLAGKNPLKLLVPFSLYELSPREHLVSGKVFASDGIGNVFEMNRKMNLIQGEPIKNLLTVIGEIGEPPFYEESSGNDTAFSTNLKKMPNLQTSVISSWFLKNEKKLIVDFRESTINDEMESLKFRIENPLINEEQEEADEGHFFAKKPKVDLEKRKSEIKKVRLLILKSTFLAIEKTIFANFPEIDSLEFRLDGNRRDYPGLEYSLVQKKIRVN